MVLLENEAFLTELTKLFQNARFYGSVTVTMKRYDGSTKSKPKQGFDKQLPEPSEYTCLVRAKSHHKKLSTIVHARDVNKFQLAYCNLMKGNLDGLKKLKKIKAKSKAAQ